MKVALLDPRPSPPRLEDIAMAFLSVTSDMNSLTKEVSKILGSKVSLPAIRLGSPGPTSELRGLKGQVDLHSLLKRVRGKTLRNLFDDFTKNFGKINPKRSRISLREAGYICVVLCAAEQIGIRANTKCISYPLNLGANPSAHLIAFVKDSRIPIQLGELKAAPETPAVALMASLTDAYTLDPLTLIVEKSSILQEIGPRSPLLLLGEVPAELSHDYLGIVETVVDDITGEQVNHIAKVLMDSGAKDVNIIPSIGKEGRPQYIVRVASEPASIQRIIEAIFENGLTLGIRVSQVKRVKLDREIVQVEVPTTRGLRKIRVKIARAPSGKVVWSKPEFEDMVRLSNETGWSLNHTNARVGKAISEKLLA